MSYILDALKRSEQERHQGELNHATIDTIMLPSKQRRLSLWPYLLIIVFLLNLAAIIYYFSHSSSKQQALSSPIGSEQNDAPTDLAVDRSALASPKLSDAKQLEQPIRKETVDFKQKSLPAHLSKTPVLTRRYELNSLPAPEKTQSSDLSDQKTYTAEGLEIIHPKGQRIAPEAEIVTQDVQPDPDPESRFEPVVEAPPPSSAPQTISQDKPVENFESIQHLSDMSGSFQAGIPDIRFNSHIYSPNPADRRVMINDLYLREGQSFSGMEIITIGEFYLVLEKTGQQFKIPVLRDWYRPS